MGHLIIRDFKLNIPQTVIQYKLSHHITKPTKWPVRPAKTQISLGIPKSDQSSRSEWGTLWSLATHWAQVKTRIRLGRCLGWTEFMLGAHHVVDFVVLLKSHLSLIFKMKRHHITGDGVYETLCPQHMLSPNNSLEMVLNLQRDITPEKKWWTLFKS